MLAPSSLVIEKVSGRHGLAPSGVPLANSPVHRDRPEGHWRRGLDAGSPLDWLGEPDADAYGSIESASSSKNASPWPGPGWPLLQKQLGVESIRKCGELDWGCSTAGVFSSYRSRTDPFASGWMIRLQHAIEAIGRRQETLLVASSSPIRAHQWELAQRCGVAACLVEVQWSRPRRILRPSKEASEPKLVVTIADQFEFPSIDSLMALLVDSMEVIHCVAKGQTERAIQLRTTALPGLGDTIHRWDQQSPYRFERDIYLPRSTSTCTSCEPGQAMAPIFPLPHVPHRSPAVSDWLVHCTRATPGPWPQQDFREHLDDILRQDRWEIPSPLETLTRILQNRRLLATGYLKRSGSRSISFSARPLRDLLDSRCYQRHLQRWDWEPYGIAIAKKHLVQLGAQPVRYGLDADSDVQARWQMEEEWRLNGDLSLADLPWGGGFVFVPDLKTATRIARISPLPVAFLSRA